MGTPVYVLRWVCNVLQRIDEVCATCNVLTEQNIRSTTAVCLVVVASIWVMHIFMGGCLGSGRQKAVHPLI